MMTRLVFDANVFASALIKPSGCPGKYFQEVVSSQQYQLILTEDIVQEIRRILFYPKVRKYISLKDEEIYYWMDALLMLSYYFVPIFKHKPMVSEDPDDDKYLIAAIEGQAQYVISGDRHLLKRNGLQGLHILSPYEFFETILK